MIQQSEFIVFITPLYLKELKKGEISKKRVVSALARGLEEIWFAICPWPLFPGID